MIITDLFQLLTFEIKMMFLTVTLLFGLHLIIHP